MHQGGGSFNDAIGDTIIVLVLPMAEQATISGTNTLYSHAYFQGAAQVQTVQWQRQCSSTGLCTPAPVMGINTQSTAICLYSAYIIMHEYTPYYVLKPLYSHPLVCQELRSHHTSTYLPYRIHNALSQTLAASALSLDLERYTLLPALDLRIALQVPAPLSAYTTPM